ncbi:MAG: hypothetical protein QG635_1328, partial [Bacteroidota bacterium]|nr:hypothetical protein [Bacteroidota bacterium]
MKSKINIRIFLYLIIFFLYITFFTLVSEKADKYVYLGISSAILPETDARDAKAAIDTWGREILKSKMKDYKLITKLFRDNDEIVGSLKGNEISWLALPALSFLILENDVSLEPVLIGWRNSESQDRFILIVNDKDKFPDIKRMKDAQMAIQLNGKGLISKLWLDNQIMKETFSSPDNFLNLKETSKESQAILSVFFNQNDACVVSESAYKTMCELNPQLNKKLKIIYTSQPYLNALFCVSRSLDAQIKNNFV